MSNAGRGQRAMIAETDLAVDKAILDLNFIGTVSLTKAVLPYFVQRKSGHVVVTSSVAGKMGSQSKIFSAATKSALNLWLCKNKM